MAKMSIQSLKKLIREEISRYSNQPQLIDSLVAWADSNREKYDLQDAFTDTSMIEIEPDTEFSENGAVGRWVDEASDMFGTVAYWDGEKWDIP